MKIWGNNFFSQELLPGLYARWAARKHIDPKLDAIEKAKEFDYPTDKAEEIAVQLKAELEEQLDRKKGLEDKIKSILFIITVSITAVTFCLKDLSVRWESPLSFFVMIFLGLSILYFVGGAVLALKSLVPIAFHSSQPSIDFDIESQRIVFTNSEKGTDIEVLLKSKLLNDLINLKVQNKTNAVLLLVRNGLILFAAFFITALLDKNVIPVQQGKALHPVEIKTDIKRQTNLKITSQDSIKTPKEIKGSLNSHSLEKPLPWDTTKNK